jgi:hypothetical protein
LEQHPSLEQPGTDHPDYNDQPDCARQLEYARTARVKSSYLRRSQAMTAATHTDQELKTALERFESCLLTPMMAGELVSWVGETKAAWAEALPLVRLHLSELHPRQYKQISKEDPELLPRTEKLKAEDALIQDDGEEFDRLLHRFAEHAPKFEPDEEKISKHLQALVDDGIEFVTRVRKQEAAVQAWFIEAFTRDRGVAD